MEGPAGQKIECEDLDEDVFETFEDLDQYTFKVYYEGRPKGSRLVMYPGVHTHMDRSEHSPPLFSSFLSCTKKRP